MLIDTCKIYRYESKFRIKLSIIHTFFVFQNFNTLAEINSNSLFSKKSVKLYLHVNMMTLIYSIRKSLSSYWQQPDRRPRAIPFIIYQFIMSHKLNDFPQVFSPHTF